MLKITDDSVIWPFPALSPEKASNFQVVARQGDKQGFLGILFRVAYFQLPTMLEEIVIFMIILAALSAEAIIFALVGRFAGNTAPDTEFFL